MDRPMTITLRLPRRLATEGIFPSRAEVLQAILVVVKDKSALRCLQKLSSSYYDVTFVDSEADKKDDLLDSGIEIGGHHVSLFESDPKSVFVSVKNLPAEVPSEKVTAVLSDFGEVLGSNNCFDEEGIWNGDRSVEMVLKKDIPSLIRIGKYPVVIRYKGQKLCCHYCPVSECPYKINKLCIRCAKAGHTARYCSQPWTLDNEPVSYNSFQVAPTQEDSTQEEVSPQALVPDEMAVDQPEGTSSSSSFVSLGKRVSKSDKPRRKKPRKQKENPDAFKETEDLNVD